MDSKSLKIVIVISSFASLDNTGFGGHYYSALATVKQLNRIHSVEVINIGDFPSPILESSTISFKYIYLNYEARLGVDRRCLLKELKSRQPDVVVAFDLPSALITRRLCVELKCGFVMVKPGGKQPRGYFPSNAFQIYFHLKDFNWAKTKFQAQDGYISCIPNRVSVPAQDWEGIEKLRKKFLINEDEITIIRISRIAEPYRQSFMAAMRLSSFLRDLGYPARLLIIGVCQNESLLKDIQKNKKAFDIVLTSPEYTKNASRLLKVANINVGIGRGFMEGCALEQHMMAINSTVDLPAVVMPENFSSFFEENFSLRVDFPVDSEKNKERIVDTAEKCLTGHAKSNFSREWFNDNFSDEKILPLYNDVLYKAQAQPEKWSLDLLRGEWILKGRLNLGFRNRVKKIFDYQQMLFLFSPNHSK